jgi:conjugal transfer ATP-binding protein TraC
MSLSFKTLTGTLLKGLFGDAEESEGDRPVLGLDMLSSFLPYRVYEPQTRLYLNARSTGFILNVAPLVGADERVGDLLGQFLSEGLPAGACVQIVHWASPRISRSIAPWFAPRYARGGVYEQIARARTQCLYDLVWTSGSGGAPFHARHHQLLVSVGVPSSSGTTKDELIAVRESLVGVLRSLDVPALDVGPVELIAFVDDLTSPTTASGDDAIDYNPLDPIADQAIRRDIELTVKESRMLLRTERFRPTGASDGDAPEIGEIYPDRFDVRHFGVRNMPVRWTPWETARLIGDLFTDKLRYPCPAATILCLVYPDQEAASTRAGMKFLRTTSLSEGKSARYVPKLREQAAEWREVQAQLQEGRRLVRAFYGVTTFSPAGDGDRNERMVKSLYKSAGWDLADERFLQVQGLLAAMPLTLADGLAADLERCRRMRTMLSTTAANIAPVQGEYLGGAVPHLLFLGRRGQPFFWSPFENGAGNHNVAILGKSGSGKSVLLQEMCASLCGAGAKVVVIDDGRSFMNSCRLQGGRFIEFTLASGFCLNPFSMVDAERVIEDEDYRLDCMAMLKAIVGQMARFIDRLTDTERGLIDQAVNRVWEEQGRTGSVEAVALALEATGNADAANLAIAMGPFRAGGTYGGFFNGEATLRLEADFTVFEMSDLATREELRSVVLTAIMFMTGQAMTRSPRSVKKLLLIDEAWAMLKGGSMSDFVETYARTARKYGGALCTATQSLNDFYKSDGATAALENSDWMLVLQQKPETIADLRKSARLDMDDRTEGLIRSLKRSGSEYSEVFIRGPECQAIGRLVLDPFSATVFSSSPDTYAAIERRLARGQTIAEAIKAVSRGEAEPLQPEPHHG